MANGEVLAWRVRKSELPTGVVLLLVEDEAAIQTLLEMELTDAGFEMRMQSCSDVAADVP